jgi:hypothetical protein
MIESCVADVRVSVLKVRGERGVNSPPSEDPALHSHPEANTGTSAGLGPTDQLRVRATKR